MALYNILVYLLFHVFKILDLLDVKELIRHDIWRADDPMYSYICEPLCVIQKLPLRFNVHWRMFFVTTQ